MAGTSVIQHQGRDIILLDFSGIQDPEVAIPTVAEAGRFVQSFPADRSALTCTDVTNTKYDRRVVDACKELSRGNAPHVKAAAVVTSSSIHRAAINMIGLVARRKLMTFETREQALDWLASQA